MKKEYLIGLLTGCLLTASALMFMGATNKDSQIGKYQLAVSGKQRLLLDTSNGQLYEWRYSRIGWRDTGSPVKK